MPPNPFCFFHDLPSFPFPKKRLLRLSAELAKGERLIASRRVNVVLCSDQKIRRLNGTYRRKEKPTDVLAFPFNDNDLLGEIYISLQRAAVQAPRYGLTYGQELERLLVHGLLHLRGYDHRSRRQRMKMQARERRYCCLGSPEVV